jgi:hypothetical protein
VKITLRRLNGDADRTLGDLRVWRQVGDKFVQEGAFATIERPWIESPDHLGGLNRKSCVPPGIYTVIPHHSVHFPNTYALVNPDLHVWYQPGDIPPGAKGRTAILIHVGNRARDVVGCVAVGKEHGTLGGEPAVLRSTLAMRELDKLLNRHRHTLEIS